MSCGSVTYPSTIPITELAGRALWAKRHAISSRALSWHALLRRGRAVPEWALRVAERRRQRHALLELNGHLLADIGLSRADAIDEARKPFWH